MTSLVQLSDFFDHDMDNGAYPGTLICGIPGMMCWGVEGIGCQGCLKDGEEDENGWEFVGEYLMPGIALGVGNISRGIWYDIQSWYRSPLVGRT